MSGDISGDTSGDMSGDMSDEKPAPSAAADDGFEALAAVCERLAGFDPDLQVHHVDGWLTALAVGPVRLPEAAWLERLFGDTFERTFADPEDHARALAVLLQRLQVLHAALDADALLARPDDLRLDPFFDEWTEEDRQHIVQEGVASAEDAAAMQPGVLWATGVLAGLEALAEPWQLSNDDDAFAEEFDELVDHVAALSVGPDSDEWTSFVERCYGGRAPERDDLLANACFAMQDMRLLLLDHGPRPEPRRVAPQPGRNDPCPCGSGKKFKKCHGAAA